MYPSKPSLGLHRLGIALALSPNHGASRSLRSLALLIGVAKPLNRGSHKPSVWGSLVKLLNKCCLDGYHPLGYVLFSALHPPPLIRNVGTLGVSNTFHRVEPGTMRWSLPYIVILVGPGPGTKTPVRRTLLAMIDPLAVHYAQRSSAPRVDFSSSLKRELTSPSRPAYVAAYADLQSDRTTLACRKIYSLSWTTL